MRKSLTSARCCGVFFWSLAVGLIASVAGAQSLALPQHPAPQQPALLQPASQLPGTWKSRAQASVGQIHSAIQSLLAQGRSLETKQRWADALNHYEQAIRKHPSEEVLRDRFGVARLHYSLERRYVDRSYVKSVQTLTAQQSLDLYSELLNKIQSHYVVTPPWQSLSDRSIDSLELAISDPAFQRQNNLRASREQIAKFRREMAQLAQQQAITSRHDSRKLARQIAWSANQQLGIRQSAVFLEFTAATAGGLDTYSAYLTADQLRDVYSQIEGNFVGLGVELKDAQGDLLIVDVIRNSPAEKAGIKKNDRIVAVDGKITRQMSTDEAASMLTGKEGSYVQVRITSPNKQVRNLNVRRQHVEVPSLEDVRILDEETGVAYIRIPTFQKSTSRDLDTALWDLYHKGMRTLVLDLRGNPGGLLNSSVEIADKFLAEGGIVSTRGRSREEEFNYRSHRAGTWRVPLVVLIDGNSASASEILAGAIHDNRRGTIVGAQSFGKGSVQGIFALGQTGAGVRLTTAKFFSPNGQAISYRGVTPDIEVAPNAASVANSQLVAYRGTTKKGDPALQRAIAEAKALVRK